MASTIRMTGALSPRESWSAKECTIARSLEVLRNRSTFLILREALYGTVRFDDFAERVDISEPVAAERLRQLVHEGLLEREPYREPGQRTRMGYRLTTKGAELLPVLAALMRWGDRWLDEGDGPVALRHHECGARVDVELHCTAGHRVQADELELAPNRRRTRAGA